VSVFVFVTVIILFRKPGIMVMFTMTAMARVGILGSSLVDVQCVVCPLRTVDAEC